MPKFTMSLKRAVELTGGFLEDDAETGMLRMVGGDIGLNHYPIFDVAHRQVINTKIINTYINDEIGYESLSMFVHGMRTAMSILMPPMNKLYLTELIEFDPLITMKLRTSSVAEVNSESTANSTNRSDSDTENTQRSVVSETPQTMLKKDADYATSGAQSRTDAVASASGEEDSHGSTSEDQSAETETTGYQGSPSQFIMDYRDTILNIDALVVQSVKPQFMGVWGTGDNYSRRINY